VRKTIVIAATGLALVSAAAHAQTQHRPGDSQPGGTHGGMMQGGTPGSAGMQPKGDTGPSSQAFHAANMKMHSAMDIAFTGKADVDFIKGMISHHQGAIDMAKVELAFGKDPEVKKLAESIIKAQEAEIAQMQAWLKKNGQ
jgi:uncharacterized protein (DUF305 family)